MTSAPRGAPRRRHLAHPHRHLDEPADVQAVTVSAGRGLEGALPPFVRVRLDDREQLVRASADGRLAVQGNGVREVAVTVLPLPGRKRWACAALEVED